MRLFRVNCQAEAAKAVTCCVLLHSKQAEAVKAVTCCVLLRAMCWRVESYGLVASQFSCWNSGDCNGCSQGQETQFWIEIEWVNGKVIGIDAANGQHSGGGRKEV